MGKGYWIIIGDAWGDGLVMVNGRMYTSGIDSQFNPRNWWPAHDGDTEERVLARHNLLGHACVRVVFDNGGGDESDKQPQGSAAPRSRSSSEAAGAGRQHRGLRSVARHCARVHQAGAA